MWVDNQMRREEIWLTTRYNGRPRAFYHTLYPIIVLTRGSLMLHKQTRVQFCLIDYGLTLVLASGEDQGLPERQVIAARPPQKV